MNCHWLFCHRSCVLSRVCVCASRSVRVSIDFASKSTAHTSWRSERWRCQSPQGSNLGEGTHVLLGVPGGLERRCSFRLVLPKETSGGKI